MLITLECSATRGGRTDAQQTYVKTLTLNLGVEISSGLRRVRINCTGGDPRGALSWVCEVDGRLALVARIWRWRAIETASNRRPILSRFLKRNLLELTGHHRDVPSRPQILAIGTALDDPTPPSRPRRIDPGSPRSSTQIVIGSVHEKVRDARLIGEAVLSFALAGVDDLLEEIRKARSVRAAA